ncbi:MAG: hypothetical protein JO001_22965 [Alphaproteobacteria bacterium]|nr:hypothetical protein [Alphaproteobacteria bacterium]
MATHLELVSINEEQMIELTAAFLPAAPMFQIEREQTDDGTIYASLETPQSEWAIGVISPTKDGRWCVVLTQYENYEEMIFDTPAEMVARLQRDDLAMH